MKFFILDTSLQGITLGLVEILGQEFRVLDFYGSAHPQEAAARLPELCQLLLHRQNLGLADLEGLLVSHGPGSFTGIKIGLSFASGWSRAGTGSRIYGLSSLKGLARQLPVGRSLALPATQTAGYFVRQRAGAGEAGVIDLGLPFKVGAFEESSQSFMPIELAELGHIEILGTWPKLEASLTEYKVVWSRHQVDDFHQRVIGGMVEDFIANSDKLSEGVLVPVYLRKSAPEEKLDNLAKSLKQD